MYENSMECVKKNIKDGQLSYGIGTLDFATLKFVLIYFTSHRLNQLLRQTLLLFVACALYFAGDQH